AFVPTKPGEQSPAAKEASTMYASGKGNIGDSVSRITQALNSIKPLAQYQQEQVLGQKGAEEQQKADIEASAAAANEAYLEVPASFKAIPEGITTMTPQAAKGALEAQGVKVPSNIGSLQSIGSYKQDLKSLPASPRKGVNAMSQQDGASYIRQFINPNYDETKYAE